MMHGTRLGRLLRWAIAAFLVSAALLSLLTWLGFRIWLNQQPEETRATLGAFGARELLRQISGFYFPEPVIDHYFA